MAPMKTSERDTQRAAVYLAVARIPAGRVATYGQVAALAGTPSQARWVGRILSELPAQSRLPWHRVVNARGELALPPGSAAHERQRELLQQEGVAFRGGRIRLATYQWRPERGEAQTAAGTEKPSRGN